MTDPWSIQKSDKAAEQEHPNENKVDNSKAEAEVVEATKYLGFEDSFISDTSQKETGDNSLEVNCNSSTSRYLPLPDCQTYLKTLECKLEKLKKSSKLVESLAEKREDCLRNLVQNDDLSNGVNCHNELLLELEASVLNSDSKVHNFYRQLQPIQPLTVGETVNIIKYDQLEEQRLQRETAEEEEEDAPASR